VPTGLLMIITLLPLFVYINAFSLCFVYLIFDHASVFFTFFPRGSMHALVVQTSYAVFALYQTACPLLCIYHSSQGTSFPCHRWTVSFLRTSTSCFHYNFSFG